MAKGETIRIIRKIQYRCQDIGCDDFDRAARNRLLVSGKMFTNNYEAIEKAVKHLPIHKPLPYWIPRGELLEVSERDIKDLSADGFTVIDGGRDNRINEDFEELASLVVLVGLDRG